MGLVAGTWCPVAAVVPLPPLWGDRPQPHLGEGAVLVLAGAAGQATNVGGALFPRPCLRRCMGCVR